MMSLHENIKKRISAPFMKLLSPTKHQKHMMPEFINVYRGVSMISYDSNPTVCDIGVLFLRRNETNQQLELNFSIDMHKEPGWKCTLDQFEQLKRPRPNFLCVEYYGITTLFKFTDAQEAQALYETVEILQSHVKVVHKPDTGLSTDFQTLDKHTLKQKRALREIRQNLMPEKSCFESIKNDAKVHKVKITKQNSIKNSFKTIVNAAKHAKSRQVKEKSKFSEKTSEENDETFPLLL